MSDVNKPDQAAMWYSLLRVAADSIFPHADIAAFEMEKLK